MNVLILGGTRFVGRALVSDALQRGWRVTAAHRGITGTTPAGVESILVDRTDDAALRRVVDGRQWDIVLDTWSGAARVATAAAAALAGRAGRYGYVSTCSVYEWGRHSDESSPVIDGDPAGGDSDYGGMKRGAELGVLASFPDAVLARAGLILGPHEDIGRLPWWLGRIALGGRVVAPGRPQRPLQYVDARDLAAWLLDAVGGSVTGAVDAIGPSGFTTTSTFLQTCVEVTGSGAELVWVDEAELADAGVQPWTQMPCWVPEGGEFAGFLEADTTLASTTGLTPRPVHDTLADTWAWLQHDGYPPPRADRDACGLPAELELELLERHGAAT